MENKTKPRSNQQAFNRVWRHFAIEGNAQCLSPDGNCVYRGKRGAGCAVGCMMPYKMAKNADKRYYTHASSDIRTVIKTMSSAKKWFSGVDTGLLVALQHAHDLSGFNDEKKYRLREVAEKFNLSIPKH